MAGWLSAAVRVHVQFDVVIAHAAARAQFETIPNLGPQLLQGSVAALRGRHHGTNGRIGATGNPAVMTDLCDVTREPHGGQNTGGDCQPKARCVGAQNP